MAKTGASASSIRAGKAMVEITGDDAGLQNALRRAQARLAAFGKGIRDIGLRVAGVGAALTAPFAAATLVFAKMGDALDKAALRTGLAVESLSALDFAAGRSGTSIGDVEKAVRKLQVNIREAQRESVTMVEAFRDLGVSADQLAGLRPEDQFLVIADALKAIEDPGRRAALAVAVLGKSGASILPLILEGSDGIARLTAEAERLGLIIDRDTATSAALFEDALGDLKNQLKAVTFQVGAALGPALTEIIRILNPIVAAVINFIRQNRTLVAGVAAAAAGLVVLGVTLTTVGVSVSLLAFAMGGLITAFGALGTVVAAVVSPLGLLAVGLTAGTVAVLRLTETGQRAVIALGVVWRSVAGDILAVLDSIRNALVAGDLDAALAVVGATVNLLWTNIKAGWTEARAALLGSFIEFWRQAQDVWFAAGATLAGVWVRVAAGFKEVWADAVDFVADLLLKIRGNIDPTFDADGARNTLRQNAANEARGRDAELARRLDEIEDGFVSGVEDRLARSEDARKLLDAATEAERAIRRNDLEAARRQLQEAINAANAARSVAGTVNPIALEDIEDLAVDVGARIQAVGSFGGGRIGQLFGGNGAAQAQLTEARKTSQNTAKTAQAVERLEARLAFA